MKWAKTKNIELRVISQYIHVVVSVSCVCMYDVLQLMSIKGELQIAT